MELRRVGVCYPVNLEAHVVDPDCPCAAQGQTKGYFARVIDEFRGDTDLLPILVPF